MTRIKWAPIGAVVSFIVLVAQLVTGQFANDPQAPYYGPEWQGLMAFVAVAAAAIFLASLAFMAHDWTKRSRQVRVDMDSERRQRQRSAISSVPPSRPFDREIEVVAPPAFLTVGQPAEAEEWPIGRKPPERIRQHSHLTVVE